MLGDEMGEKIVAVSFDGGKKLTIGALKKMVRGILKLLQKGGDALFHKYEKANVKNLEKDGSQIQGIPVNSNEVAAINKYMKKYNIDYSIMQSTNDKEKYTFFFKVKDISKFEHAAKDFLDDKTLDNDSLGEKILKARDEALNINKTRQQERNKTKSKSKSKGRDR